MPLHRREFFGAAIAGISMTRLFDAAAAPALDSASTSGIAERISDLASKNRYRLDYASGQFSGQGWDWLTQRGRESHFFMLGEEHGIAENAKLAAALFRELTSAGYSRVGIEISPPTAFDLDQTLRRGGFDAGRRYLTTPENFMAFFGMREEAEWIASARAAVPGKTPILWGLDYEIGADRRLISLLKDRAPASAAQSLAVLEAASNRSWASYAKTRSLGDVFGFSGDPTLVRSVRAAWPRPGARIAWILDTLEETLEINNLWVARKAWASNARRADLLRNNFLRHWRAEQEPKPRVFLKLGASHIMRGRSSTEVFDLGTLIPELAEIQDRKVFQLLVLPGDGAEIAQLDPARLAYVSRRAEGDYSVGLGPLFSQVYDQGYTIFDTHPIRPLLGYSRAPQDPILQRMVHGFDAILIMTGSTASIQLQA